MAFSKTEPGCLTSETEKTRERPSRPRFLIVHIQCFQPFFRLRLESPWRTISMVTKLANTKNAA